MASGKICYVGYFESFVYGYLWKAPAIYTLDCNYLYPKDILHITWKYPFENDMLDNEKVKEALKNANIFHGGLKVEITDIVIYPADTTTVEYTLTITNNDPNNLYVLDPEKAGTFFYYYTTGPFFYNLTTNKTYDANRKIVSKPDPISSYRPEWFTKIESNNIKRTVKLKGYSDIPYGIYLMNFRFPSPIYSMEKEKRLLADGRYWIGDTFSGIIKVDYQSTRKCKVYKN